MAKQNKKTKNGQMPEGTMALVDALDQLREEITTAELKAQNKGLQFELDEVELEFHVFRTTKKKSKKGGKAGPRWLVVTGDVADEKIESKQQKVKFKLKPRKQRAAQNSKPHDDALLVNDTVKDE